MIFEKKSKECRCGYTLSGRTVVTTACRLMRHAKSEHEDLWEKTAYETPGITPEEMYDYLFGDGEAEYVEKLLDE